MTWTAQRSIRGPGPAGVPLRGARHVMTAGAGTSGWAYKDRHGTITNQARRPQEET